MILELAQNPVVVGLLLIAGLTLIAVWCGPKRRK